MLYTALLHLHSVWRWVAFLLPVILLNRAARAGLVRAAYAPLDRKLLLATTIALDVQLLLGLALWAGVSPLGLTNFGATPGLMKNPVLRYWAVEHGPTMLLAIGAFHGITASAKRLEDEAAKHKRVAIACAVVVVLVLVNMPWPGRVYGRPLFPGG
jgi:hypothetical protein